MTNTLKVRLSRVRKILGKAIRRYERRGVIVRFREHTDPLPSILRAQAITTANLIWQEETRLEQAILRLREQEPVFNAIEEKDQ